MHGSGGRSKRRPRAAPDAGRLPPHARPDPLRHPAGSLAAGGHPYRVAQSGAAVAGHLMFCTARMLSCLHWLWECSSMERCCFCSLLHTARSPQPASVAEWLKDCWPDHVDVVKHLLGLCASIDLWYGCHAPLSCDKCF